MACERTKRNEVLGAIWRNVTRAHRFQLLDFLHWHKLTLLYKFPPSLFLSLVLLNIATYFYRALGVGEARARLPPRVTCSKVAELLYCIQC